MADVQQAATTGVGVLGGVGTTLLVRSEFDQPGEGTVLKPSVLWGLGTGILGLGAPMVLGMNGAIADVAYEYGAASLGAGLLSAFVVGGSVQAPSV